MSDSSDQLKDALLDAVVALTRERYSRASADDGEAFIRGYYQRAAPQDLTDKDPIDLYGAAVRHVRLGDVRGPHETLVRVYNPYITDDGWSSNHTVIDVVCEDMPFIVDSVLALLEQQRRQIHVLVHPIFDVIRSADGTLEEVSVQSNSGFVAATDAAGGAESFLHVEIDRLAAGEELERLRHTVESVIADVRAAVTDWRAMREQALAVAAEMETWADEPQPRFEAVVGEDPEEIAALLRWMEEGYFTFLGYREYDFVDDPDDPQITSRPATGLGIMRQLEPSVRHLGLLPVETTERARRPNILNLTKANSLSTVHRSVPLDYVGIKEISPDGIVTGERRFVGLFTSAVYSGRVSDIPVVRAKVAEVVGRSDFAPGSHDHSRLVNILQLHPRDDLIQIGVDQLEAMVLDILDLRDRRQVSLLVRRDDFGRFLSCLVFVPRDRHSTEVRLEIQRILLEVYHGTSVRFSTVISNDPLARLHIVIYSKPVPASELPDVEAVQARLSQVIRTWDDYLRKSLVAAHGEGQGLDLFERYRGAFSTAYRSNVLAEAAVDDIGHLEALGDQDLDVVLQKPLDADFKVLRCKLYRAEDPITLSQFIPLLHDLGAVVIDEIPFAVRVDGERRRFVYDIGIRLEQELDRDGRDRLREAVLAVWNDRGRERQPRPTRDRRGCGLGRRGGAPCLRPLPQSARHTVQPDLREGDDQPQSRDRLRADPVVPCPIRSRSPRSRNGGERAARGTSAPSTMSPASTPTASSDRSCRSSRPRSARTGGRSMPVGSRVPRWRSRSTCLISRARPGRFRRRRSSCTAHEQRVCTFAPAARPAAGCGGLTAWRTTARRSSGS